MERNRNWLGVVAVALAGLALVVALAGRFGPGLDRIAFVQAPQAPQALQAPQAPQAPDMRGLPGRGDQGVAPGFERGQGGFHPGRGHGRPDFAHGFARDRHGFGLFGPLAMIFGLVNFLAKIAALGLLAWLLLRLFQQRNTPPAAPTTPAGHDPRVE
jgi:hypothetical protein